MHPLIAIGAVLVGLVCTLLFGLTVKPLIRRATESMSFPPPSEALASAWKRLVAGDEGGAVLGHLERLLFFGAFLGGADVLVASWLGFKVASKWNAWTNVVAVPKDLPGIDPIEYLIARRNWASHVLVTFLIGTLANMIAGYAGAVAARYVVPFL